MLVYDAAVGAWPACACRAGMRRAAGSSRSRPRRWRATGPGRASPRRSADRPRSGPVRGGRGRTRAWPRRSAAGSNGRRTARAAGRSAADARAVARGCTRAGTRGRTARGCRRRRRADPGRPRRSTRRARNRDPHRPCAPGCSGRGCRGGSSPRWDLLCHEDPVRRPDRWPRRSRACRAWTHGPLLPWGTPKRGWGCRDGRPGTDSRPLWSWGEPTAPA